MITSGLIANLCKSAKSNWQPVEADLLNIDDALGCIDMCVNEGKITLDSLFELCIICAAEGNLSGGNEIIAKYICSMFGDE